VQRRRAENRVTAREQREALHRVEQERAGEPGERKVQHGEQACPEASGKTPFERHVNDRREHRQIDDPQPAVRAGYLENPVQRGARENCP